MQRAPRYVFVMGEVNSPGRYELTGPTTVLQSLSMAGSWRVGANLRQIVVFRRGDDWRLLATMVDLEAALLGNRLCPRDEIWIGDSDVIIVPKGRSWWPTTSSTWSSRGESTASFPCTRR